MDKLVGQAVQKVMGAGEKKAPVKSIKLKVKFGKDEVEKKKRGMAKRMAHPYPKSVNV